MCTVSWLVENDGYHLFFNRDEQRSRSLALVPRFIKVEDTCALMPIDPDGNGSWISTNEFGVTLCLLNFYQGQTPKGKLISRGLLLKALSAHTSVSSVDILLMEMSLNEYASFSLLAFGSDDNGNFCQQSWQWNGQQLKRVGLSSPFTSSSVEFESVIQSRLSLAGQLFNTASASDMIRYHQSHYPSKGHLSVCMHREDAKSVSFSHINVRKDCTTFDYKNASPCSNQLTHTVELKHCLIEDSLVEGSLVEGSIIEDSIVVLNTL